VNIQLFLLIIVVITALAFDFTNGFHDTGNAMATSIASGALKPKAAVALSAVLNLVGAFMSTAVAATIAKGLIDGHIVTLELVFAGLVGGIVWNLLTWLLGIPSSSSHALIGGIVGATIAARKVIQVSDAHEVERLLAVRHDARVPQSADKVGGECEAAAGLGGTHLKDGLERAVDEQ